MFLIITCTLVVHLLVYRNFTNSAHTRVEYMSTPCALCTPLLSAHCKLCKPYLHNWWCLRQCTRVLRPGVHLTTLYVYNSRNEGVCWGSGCSP